MDSLWRLNISFLPSFFFCLWLVELSADCVNSPTGLWLDYSLISNPVEVFPVFVRSLKQISWKYKLSHKPQERKWRKMFQHMAGLRYGRGSDGNIYSVWVTPPETTKQQKCILCKPTARLSLYTYFCLVMPAIYVMSLWYCKTVSAVSDLSCTTRYSPHAKTLIPRNVVCFC